MDIRRRMGGFNYYESREVGTPLEGIGIEVIWNVKEIFLE